MEDVSAHYVIVGAGSAGCALAGRLGADPDATVVVIEAGGPDDATAVKVPAAYPTLFGSELDWCFRTVEQAHLGGRRLEWPRGKVVGGTSSINGQIWTRGHRADFDGWAAGGCTGWAYEDVLPYFVRTEAREAPETGPYGTAGPMRVAEPRDPSGSSAAFLAACASAGHEALGVRESSAHAAAGPARVNQHHGRRWSSADAYLRPALARGNVRLLTGATADRVIVEDGRAVGVEVASASGTQVVRADREVVLATGAIGSPALLERSGIGQPERLASLGVEVVAASPEVGHNLQDHLYVPVEVATSRPVGPGDAATDMRAYLGGRRGPLSSNLAEALVFLTSTPGLPAPDLELVWMVVPPLADAAHRGDAPDEPHDDQGRATLCVVLLQPFSSGTVSITTTDPADPPRIDPAYLSDPDGGDLRTLVAGVGAAETVLDDPALAPWVAGHTAAGWAGRSSASAEAHVRGSAQTLYHPVGTCRMGSDQRSVVDPQLRVRGVDGLRVADASVMPSVPRAHTHAPSVLIAERAADLIAGTATA